MELISLILSVSTIVGLAVVWLLWRNFMPAYAVEKAKNLASKEDLAHLTSVVEKIKAAHAADVERLKSNLMSEAQATERRRKVYEEMCHALRVFIEGHDSSGETKSKFHAAYAAAWLWVSDDVLNELNRFIELQRQHSANQESISQEQLKSAYVSTVLAMRKDAGFASTAVQAASYQFVQF
ncbi:hypothetical protein E4695_12755 [Alcaligenaceae bacterium 429]|nr:hypothetical protein E4695_12755 [Alcaligenaceae bacterium 429]